MKKTLWTAANAHSALEMLAPPLEMLLFILTEPDEHLDMETKLLELASATVIIHVHIYPSKNISAIWWLSEGLASSYWCTYSYIN